MIKDGRRQYCSFSFNPVMMMMKEMKKMKTQTRIKVTGGNSGVKNDNEESMIIQ
jgi:hypothetical protein